MIFETGQTLQDFKALGQGFKDWFVAGLEVPQSDLLAFDIVAGQSLRALKQLAENIPLLWGCVTAIDCWPWLKEANWVVTPKFVKSDQFRSHLAERRLITDCILTSRPNFTCRLRISSLCCDCFQIR